MKPLNQFELCLQQIWSELLSLLLAKVYFGRNPANVPQGSIVFFPIWKTVICCGLAGLVSLKMKGPTEHRIDLEHLIDSIEKMEQNRFTQCEQNELPLEQHYLSGKECTTATLNEVQTLKRNENFYQVFINNSLQERLIKLAERLWEIIQTEEKLLSDRMGRLDTLEVETMSQRIEELKDIHWCLKNELCENIKKIKSLLKFAGDPPELSVVQIFKQINTVLNSLGRLEVRGRDSAGLSLLFILDGDDFGTFKETLQNINLFDEFSERSSQEVLTNRSISLSEINAGGEKKQFSMTMTYKVAAEVGSLGDNIIFLRWQIQNDPIFQTLANFPHIYHTVLSHTRWASVGAITEPNCHPVDNRSIGQPSAKSRIIHVCLNGDIDNYIELKREFEVEGNFIHQDITTDTKIIPIQIEKYLKDGFGIEESFRLAVNDFEGSHAISMHTDLAPGKIFLAQKGSGQAIFIGMADDHYLATSEVYGFVEETPAYVKLDGEMIVEGRKGKTQGQIFILSQDSSGGMEGLKAMFYDGTPFELGEKDIKYTEITSRDIDRQEFPHYFLKEISESPVSVEKTLQNRWKIKEGGKGQYVITLAERTFPETLRTAFIEEQIRRIFFVGQGTAGVAALACANILNYYLDDPSLYISAMKASELSGFKMSEQDDPTTMSDTLVVAISQSGTTTDTNRAVDMAKERGAHTLAIVNRRDSDITFKVDGVMYTSSGRDIEMSVASTKAFYSQIVAGALLGLHMAALKQARTDEFIAAEINQLIALPSHMKKILKMRDKIEASAKRLAITKTYWAAVGSGPNKASADEIRIKLSELCYKTISTDYVEDKKHIDLSSEPLIIVCAAGTRPTVIGDIIKDTAIFQAHKAIPIVIADEGENRFAPFAADVFHVPIVSEHLAPIVNTLVGHVWGYYAALAIDEGSRFFYNFREGVQSTINEYAKTGLDIIELVLEKSFREKIVRFYEEFRKKKASNRLPLAMGLESASDLTLLLKYLAGKLPVPDFELDFGKKGTARNMLDTLFECISEAIDCMARPVDAIKHQAKTVTVGTSRIREKVEGILFDALAAQNISISQLTNSNIIVIRNLQGIVANIAGSIFYRIGKLNLLGEPTDETTIEVIQKEGVLKPIPSRVDTDIRLKGTKRIIVREGNVYIGKGRKDDRSILVIPIISTSPSAPNLIEYMLLLNISFRENIPLSTKIKALGGKFERIKNIVQENSIIWEDKYLEMFETEDLFGRSAEKIGDSIVSRLL